jgi:hypothetical protein
VSLTREQVDALLQPIAGARVSKQKDRNTGREQSHVQAYDIRRRLTNIFGFGGWSGEVLSMDLIGEYDTEVGKEQKRPGVTVGYRCTYRLTIHATGAVYTESATGDGTMGIASRWDAHDFAMKTAESQAFKRCAINLGDQFGLSLYNGGSIAPLVVYVLGDDMAKWTPEGIIRVTPKGLAQVSDDAEVNGTDHVTEPLAPETPAPGGDEAPPGADSPPAHDPPSLAAGDELPVEEPPQVELAREVDRIVGDDETAASKRARLTKVLMHANKLKVRSEYVSTPDGEARTLEAYIQQAISEVGK